VPDVVTHAAVGFLLKAGTGGGRVPVFLLGSLLPDLLSYVPGAAIAWFSQHVWHLPAWSVYFWYPFHLPVGVLATSLAVAYLFPEAGRGRVFLELAAAGLLHLLLDLLQFHLGPGYLLLFPFSDKDFEFGLIGSESTVPFALPLAFLAALAWRIRRGRWRPWPSGAELGGKSSRTP
jgi:hypothetical protein